MFVPHDATFDDFGLGVDLAFGRWDITRGRTFRTVATGRHEAKERAGVLNPGAILRDTVLPGSRFEYVFDDENQWLHECIVQALESIPPEGGVAPIPVPILGWGSVPDQFGRIEAPDTARERAEHAEHLAVTPPTALRRRRRATPTTVDLEQVRAALAGSDAAGLSAALEGRDLSSTLQQVGDALVRVFRSTRGADRTLLRARLTEVHDLLGQRGWDGDDVLASEIADLLSGSVRRSRTLAVRIEDLADVMASGGDDPGGYLHLDTGEVVHAFLHHGMEGLDEDTSGDPASDSEGDEEGDNLWIYVDHDTHAGWDDMRAFADATPGDVGKVLGVAIRGKGAFARFRRTVDEFDLWPEWQVFSDDRHWGRARAMLRSIGIRPV